MVLTRLNQAPKPKRRERDVRNFRKEALFWLFDAEEENSNSEIRTNTDGSVSEFKKCGLLQNIQYGRYGLHFLLGKNDKYRNKKRKKGVSRT
jgi:hypothetical protein